jgi:hypothetical protein
MKKGYDAKKRKVTVTMSTDVTRTRQEIDLRIEAARRALHAPAAVANHQSITARMERLAVHLQALERAGLHTELKEVIDADDLWEQVDK